jgi:FSR family fosmidomycin resistance protein-like MFS transporter
LLSIGHFVIDLYSSALGALQPHLVGRLGLTLQQAGMIGGVMIFSSSVMQPAYGYLSDRLHTRAFTILAPAVAGIFISALGLAPTYAVVLLLVVLGGAGIASFHPQGSALAVAGARSTAGRSMAIFVSAGTLGMAIGPAYFAAIIGRTGFENSLWAAVPGVLATATLIWLLPRANLRSTLHVDSKLDWDELYIVRRPLLVLYFLVFIRSIVQITYAQFLPLYLHRERGFSLQTASLYLSMYLASGAIGGFLGGHLADRFGGRHVILVSMLGSVPFLATFFAASGALSAAGLALGGLILLFTVPVNVVMAQQLAPRQAGTVSALMMGFSWGMAGLFFIPLTGFVADRLGLHTALASLTLFPLAGAALALLLPKARPA